MMLKYLIHFEKNYPIIVFIGRETRYWDIWMLSSYVYIVYLEKVIQCMYFCHHFYLFNNKTEYLYIDEVKICGYQTLLKYFHVSERVKYRELAITMVWLSKNYNNTML